MDRIEVSRVSTEELKKLRVDEWSLWECEPSVFDWEYDLDETAYVLEGHVLVSTPEGVVEIKAGDLARFPQGLQCTWNVKERIRKVYRFGD